MWCLLLLLSAFYNVNGNSYYRIPVYEIDNEIANKVAINHWQKWAEIMSRYANPSMKKENNYVMISTIISSDPFER